MHHTEEYSLIKGEWKKFVNNEELSNNHIIPTFILESWSRCRANNVNPYSKELPSRVGNDATQTLLKKNEKIISISQPFMVNLYNFFSGSGFLVALYDHKGYLLHLLGDGDFLEAMSWGDSLIGGCWSEEVAGTNGPGLAIIEDRPVQIFACQHYRVISHHLTSSAAPIHNEDKSITGVIVVAGPYQRANPHTLGMVAASAFAIEQEIRLRNTLQKLQLSEILQNLVLSSIPQGVIAVDNNNIITTMNKNAMNILCLQSYMGENIHDILWRNNNELLKLIVDHDNLTDVEVRINSAKGQGSYTLCCYPIFSEKRVIGKIIILNELKRVRALVTKMMGAKAKTSFDDIIGHNLNFLKTIEQGKIAAEIQSNVLLMGESGTGKDLFAQAIHNKSNRRECPYIAINCSSIPVNLITSELFGYSDGAFTGSKRGGNPGKFELADGGTIFLDEIGEIPFELQTALLRVIEDKSIFRLGGTKVTNLNTRIITATNRNLLDEVNNKNFRHDLYYRLNVFTIAMIPLRERKDDIPILVDYFIYNLNRTTGKNIFKTDEEVMEKLYNYNWPGNIRELQNTLERMVNMARSDVLTLDILPDEIAGEESATGNIKCIKYRNEIDSELITKLVQANIPKKEIARQLGISRTTVYRKLGYNI